MVTKVVNNKTGELLFLCRTEFPHETMKRVFIEINGTTRTFQVVDAVPYYTRERIPCEKEHKGKTEETFVFVEELDTPVDVDNDNVCPGYKPDSGGFRAKYLVVKRDGTPVKEASEYLILNIVHDPAAQQAAKVYCDAQRDPRFREFVEGLQMKIQGIRKGR